ncbi:MAG: alanyl-tRNA editing protein, partial [Alcaligenes sp.]
MTATRITATRKRFDDEPYLDQCDATIIAVTPEGVELDETICYARSGGQAGDSGTLTLSDGRVLTLADTVYADDRQRI